MAKWVQNKTEDLSLNPRGFAKVLSNFSQNKQMSPADGPVYWNTDES